MMMGFVIELFFTASLSLCLAFLFAKLVSMASVGGNGEVVLTSTSGKEEEEEEEMSGLDEGVLIEKPRGGGGLGNQGLEVEEKVELVGEPVKRLEVMYRGEEYAEESFELMILEKEKGNIVGFEDQLIEEKDVEVSSLIEDNLVVEIPKKEVCKICEKQEEGIVKDESVEADQEFELKLDNRGGDVEEEDEGLFNEDDDWEGIEKSEVEKLFSSASKFVASTENNELLAKLGNDMVMQLYGLHKVAMEGPCREPPPLAIMVSARTKWNAWQRLGNMTPEVAMEEYLNLLSGGIPGWMEGNPEGDHEQDKCNVVPEAGEPRIKTHDNLSIHHQPDSKNERKPEEPQPQGESNDANSL